MLTFAKKYEGNIWSQNGEDLIIEECLRRMNFDYGLSVEFGGHDGYYCSNTRNLIEKGWKGLMYDVTPNHADVMKAEITTENINSYVPSCNVASFDTDGPDFELLQAWKNRADLIVIEINSSFPPTVEYYSKRNGASYRSMCKLLIDKGYFVICHTGNLIAVQKEYRHLFPEIPDDPIEQWALFFNTWWL